jgi:hypothetical protein
MSHHNLKSRYCPDKEDKGACPVKVLIKERVYVKLWDTHDSGRCANSYTASEMNTINRNFTDYEIRKVF